jgi:hypothetical protein
LFEGIDMSDLIVKALPRVLGNPRPGDRCSGDIVAVDNEIIEWLARKGRPPRDRAMTPAEQSKYERS